MSAAMELVYGIHSVRELLERAGQGQNRVQRLLLQTGRHDKRVKPILGLARKLGVPVEECSRQQLDLRVDGNHQGVVLECEPLPQLGEKGLLQLLAELPGPPLLLVLDGITDPHNLGACLRSADAAGVSAVIAPRDNSVGLTPAVRKVACGAAETVPFVQVANLARTLDALKQQGIWLVGAAGEAESPVYELDLKGSIALVMGAEGSGMRRLTRERCDFLAHIPMAGSVSSLNVSVATGICLFEAVRQRRVD
jgi:23S rRNA (guanosine2251-2'-O)-methyltransferase